MQPLTTFARRSFSRFVCKIHTGPRCAYSSARKSGKGGFALLEALIAAALLTVVLAGAIGALLITSQTGTGNGARIEATYMADEGIEAVRLMRDSGWSANIASHTTDTTFYLEWDGTTWVATDTNTYIDGAFERALVLSDVYRDGSQQIAASGSLESDARRVTVTVSWRENDATSTRSLSAYITNLFDN